MNKKSPNKIKKNILNRYKLIMALILVFCFINIVTLAKTTLVNASHWNERAKKELQDTKPIPPERGAILAADGSMLAVDVMLYDICVDLNAPSNKIDTLKAVLDPLCDSLALINHSKTKDEWKKLFEEEIKKEPKKRSTRILLAARRPIFDYKRIKNFPYFNIKGVRSLYTDKEEARLKPYGSMASRSIGRVATDSAGFRHGINGLERALDSLLFGTMGKGTRVQMTTGFLNWAEVSPVKGYDIKTTIDVQMQDILENELLNVLTETKAEWGTAILMEVATGDIKAISNFDRAKNDSTYFEGVNHAVLGYEPGSVIKPISMMIALEDKVVNPNEKIATGRSFPYRGGNPITDAHAHTALTPLEIIAASSNIGMSKITIRGFEDNPGRFYTRMKEIGMLDRLNIGIAGETVPRIDSLGNRNWDLIDLTRTSYGYRTQIPPIYTLAMYNAMANGGKFVRPRLVKELWKNDVCDSVIPVSYVREHVCSPETAKLMCEMLKAVVWSNIGTGKSLRNNFVKIAGKTGTCYMVDEETGKYTNKKRMAFCGFFPADNPKYTCMVLIAHPINAGAARSSGMVLMNTALKMYARGMLDNISDYRQEENPEHTYATLYNVSPQTRRELQATLKDAKAVIRHQTTDKGVPSVIGMGSRDAIRTLEKAGLNVRKIEGEGYVYAQSLQPGTAYKRGSNISLQLKKY